MIVWLAQDGALNAWRVTGSDGARATVTREGATLDNIASGRVFWKSAATAADDAACRAHEDAARARASAFDAEATWSVLQSEGALSPVSPEAFAARVFDAQDPVSVDAVAVAIFGDGAAFKMRRGVVEPLGEALREKRAAAAAEADRIARLESSALDGVKARIKARAEGAKSGVELGAPEGASAVVLAALTRLAVHGFDGADGEMGLAVGVLDQLQPGARGPEVRAFDLLVAAGVFDADENLDLRRRGHRRVFPADALEEAATRAAGTPSQLRPKDLRHLLTVAIDDAETTEVDDAFAMRGDTLYIFIADISAYVPRDGMMEKEARQRVSTIYLPEGKIPMLPSAVSEVAASLTEGVDRPALCFAFEVAEDGGLRGLEVMEAQCRVDRRMTYIEADEILDGDPEADGAKGKEMQALSALMRNVAAAMDRHRAARVRAGALQLQRSEIRVSVDGDGIVDVRRTRASGPSRELVAETMVSVCAGAALWCVDHNVPAIYRVQPAPAGVMVRPGAMVSDPAERIAILRRLRPTSLTTKPNLHFTLGVSAYTQVTSPLRRYQDLLMQMQIKGALRTGRPPFRAGHLSEVFEHLDKTVGSIRRLEKRTRRYWTLRFLEQNPDHLWDASVVRQNGRTWVVELTDLGLQVPLNDHGATHPFMGEHLKVRIVDANARADRLSIARGQANA